MRPQLGAAAGPDGAIADGAAMTGAIDAAVHDAGRLSTAAIDAAALAEVEAALAAEHVAPLPVSQAVALQGAAAARRLPIAAATGCASVGCSPAWHRRERREGSACRS